MLREIGSLSSVDEGRTMNIRVVKPTKSNPNWVVRRVQSDRRGGRWIVIVDGKNFQDCMDQLAVLDAEKAAGAPFGTAG